MTAHLTRPQPGWASPDRKRSTPRLVHTAGGGHVGGGPLSRHHFFPGTCARESQFFPITKADAGRRHESGILFGPPVAVRPELSMETGDFGIGWKIRKVPVAGVKSC